jgi:hypothetical protein
VCIHQNFLHRVYTNLNSSFLDPSFLEWWLGCKTCIVYTGLKSFYSHLNAQFYACHPSIFIFLDVLLKIQTTSYIKIRTLDIQAVTRKHEKERLCYRNIWKLCGTTFRTISELKTVSTTLKVWFSPGMAQYVVVLHADNIFSFLFYF